jgi:hypothetical protein
VANGWVLPVYGIALFDVSASPAKKMFSLGEVTDPARGAVAVSPSHELLAFYAGGPSELGAVWIWRPGSGVAPKRLSTGATGLAMVDQYDRLWLERQGAIIVRTNSGKGAAVSQGISDRLRVEAAALHRARRRVSIAPATTKWHTVELSAGPACSKRHVRDV